jgi:23S rRNA (cytidine1920-2'-O)/16S rRNA (cytidine1409-2'-O)-methyltransferase
MIRSPKYINCGGYRLETALGAFNINPKDCVCVDIGASRGGFTECLLERGAKKVYGIDVGASQFFESTHKNKKDVEEKVDLRSLILPEKADITMVDISHISLTYILKDIAGLTKEGGNIIVLIKPQFELGKEHILKDGRVDPEFREEAIKKVCNYASTLGLLNKGITESPTKGVDGNIEFFAWFGKKCE